MRDGKVVWRHDVPRGKMAASPAVFGNSLVVHGMDGVVRVLDRRTGRLLWRHGVGSPIESSPVVRDGVDYCVLLRFPHGEYVPVSGNGGRLLLHGYSRLYAVEPVKSLRS